MFRSATSRFGRSYRQAEQMEQPDYRIDSEKSENMVKLPLSTIRSFWNQIRIFWVTLPLKCNVTIAYLNQTKFLEKPRNLKTCLVEVPLDRKSLRTFSENSKTVIARVHWIETRRNRKQTKFFCPINWNWRASLPENFQHLPISQLWVLNSCFFLPSGTLSKKFNDKLSCTTYLPSFCCFAENLAGCISASKCSFVISLQEVRRVPFLTYQPNAEY